MKTHDLALHIRGFFPAEGYNDLLHRVNGSLAEPVTKDEINQAIAYVRRNSLALGWTIPHCRRGRDLPGDNRLVTLANEPVHRDLFLPGADQRRAKIIIGLIGTLSTVAQQLDNLSRASGARHEHEPSVAIKRDVAALKKDCEYVSGKLRDLENDLRAA